MNDDLPHALRQTWHRFADTYEPLRTELYRYCRHLTRSPWDAEDLAQDTLTRAFATMGRMGEAPPNPRAWLFRVASNAWLDGTARRRPVEPHIAVAAPALVVESREAAGTLLSQLSPQERVAVVLKEAFDFSLEEIAATLGTTTGAIKAALHRGRGKLAEPEVGSVRTPARATLDAFCEAFNARDIPRVTALLLESAEIEIVGASSSFGDDVNRGQMLHGMMFGSRRLANADTEGGIEPRFMQGARPSSPRVEVRLHRDEWVVLFWYDHDDGEAVRAICRAETDGPHLSRLWNYFFTPDVIAEVCGELGVRSKSNGYRWWIQGRPC